MVGQSTTSLEGQGASPTRAASSALQIDLSIIAPARNEEGNISGLLADVEQALGGLDLRFEMILVDDGSTDQTTAIMEHERRNYAWLSCYRLSSSSAGTSCGQSAAFHAGIRLSRGSAIALMDADRQYDPADLPSMLKEMAETSADMIQGDRTSDRKDSMLRRVSSWVGRTFCRALLGDTVRDTGCSLRIFRRELGLLLPLQYRGMHRFIPAYARALGYRVVEVPVHHRARTEGETKYGIWDRALPGLRDLFAMRWMRRRICNTAARPIENSDSSS